MKKSILILLTIVSCFFVSSLEVRGKQGSIYCIYQDSSGEKIKLELINSGLYGKLFTSVNSTDYKNFMPVDGINGPYTDEIGEKVFYFNNIHYENNNNISHLNAGVNICPLSITNYYIEENGPFNTYISNVLNCGDSSECQKKNETNSMNIPIISFSDNSFIVGFSDDKLYSLFSSARYFEKCLSDQKINENCGIYGGDISASSAVGRSLKTKKYTINVADTLSNNNTSESENDLSCTYRNSSGESLTFNFKPTIEDFITYKYEYNNKTYKAYYNSTNSDSFIGDSFTSCPSTVLFKSFPADDAQFSTPSLCDAYEKNCFYREDLEFTYENNSKMSYRYIRAASAGGDIIYINILKVPDEDGNEINVTRGLKNVKLDLNNLSEFKSILLNDEKEKIPKYIVAKESDNGMVYPFSNEADSSAKYNYILSSYLLNMSLDGEEIKATCEAIFGKNFMSFLNNNVLKIIYIGVPILLIVLTSFDFAKAVFVDDKEGIQKATKNFGKRVVVAVLIYFVPNILIFITNIIGVDEIEDCVKWAQTIAAETGNQ